MYQTRTIRLYLITITLLVGLVAASFIPLADASDQQAPPAYTAAHRSQLRYTQPGSSSATSTSTLTATMVPSSTITTTPTPLPTSTAAPVTATPSPSPTPTIPCGVGDDPQPWSLGTTGPGPHVRHGAASSPDAVYIFGGDDYNNNYLNELWRWHPADGSWIRLADMPSAKPNIQGTYWDGKLYVPGGQRNKVALDENAIYDIATNSWSLGAPVPDPRGNATAAWGGKVYVFGGNINPSAATLIYDIQSNSWSRGADMPVSIFYGRAVTAGDYIYYIGGIVGLSTVSNGVYRYDPQQDSWTTLAPLQLARQSPEVMAAPDGRKIYVVNGGTGQWLWTPPPLDETVEVYDIATNIWSYGSPVVQPLAASAGGLAGGKLMVQGGDDHYTMNTVQVSMLGGGIPCPTSTPGGLTDTPTPTLFIPPTATLTATPNATPPPTPTDCPNPFVDIQGNLFYPAIHYLGCYGVVSGLDGSHYGPSATSTRGQFARVVVKGFGLPITTPSGGGQTFSDVPPSYFAYNYVETGLAAGILSGYDQNSCQAAGVPYPCYLPNRAITRAELTKQVVKAAGYPRITPTTDPTFVDVPTTYFAYIYIETAYAHGIINGVDSTHFAPGRSIRRDEMAQIVYKGVITP